MLLRGKGHYTDDVSLPNQAYMVMVRSQNAHGVITSVDTEAAAKLESRYAARNCPRAASQFSR